MPGENKGAKSRKWVCSRCGRGFSSMAHLIAHAVKHKGEKGWQNSKGDKK